MKTVTYDETQWKLVPIEACVQLQIGWAYVDAARESSPERDWAFSHAGYKAMIKAAPPYPEAAFDQITKSLMAAARKEGHKVTMKIKWAAPKGEE